LVPALSSSSSAIYGGYFVKSKFLKNFSWPGS
jgi:hypothetical protein